MNAATQNVVRLRAAGICEYCHIPMAYFREKFSFDHIVARQHGGGEILENLAFCCMRCNRHKGTNLSGLDPLTGLMVRIFHPRLDRWEEHFCWRDSVLVGRTSEGRATIVTLNMNDPVRLAIREELMKEWLFPPSESPRD